MKNIVLTLLIVTWATWTFAQSPLLQSGPMLGYAEMTEALIWVQSTEPAEVWAEYTLKNQRVQGRETNRVMTQKTSGFTAKLIADELSPGQEYSYQLFINGIPIDLPYPTTFRTQSLWQWRENPPEFTLAAGSCAYVGEEQFDRPGKPYGGEYQIFTTIDSMQPDLMLWLGDNTYLREADWNSRSGIFHRYTHTRSLPELQPLLASTNHYAIWDDHDYGPNDSDRSYIHKDKTRTAFEAFWGNPTFGLPGQEGITSYFQWADVDFFLLDNRWFRSPNNCESCEPTILGEAQLNWLIEALVTSRASFKIVAIGGQVLNPAPVFENYANRYKKERDRLLQRIEKENIQGVVFLNGDRHHTELSQVTNGMGNALFDLTVSPLTSTASRNNGNEGNLHRVEGTYVNERNFALLTFSGKRNQRLMTIRTYKGTGELIWERIIEQPGRK
ncbi:MAG: alkaline phosphatase family protein [Saprospiraceae bacterium]|nr:alkaline phosphatase family protein [Saprospiraceae bacterium]